VAYPRIFLEGEVMPGILFEGGSTNSVEDRNGKYW
jgi:hypothetical protein